MLRVGRLCNLPTSLPPLICAFCPVIGPLVPNLVSHAKKVLVHNPNPSPELRDTFSAVLVAIVLCQRINSVPLAQRSYKRFSSNTIAALAFSRTWPLPGRRNYLQEAYHARNIPCGVRRAASKLAKASRIRSNSAADEVQDGRKQVARYMHRYEFLVPADKSGSFNVRLHCFKSSDTNLKADHRNSVAERSSTAFRVLLSTMSNFQYT